MNLRSSACGTILGTSNGNEKGVVSSITTAPCSGVTYTWLQFRLMGGGPTYWVADTGSSIRDCGVPSGSKYFNVTYVNQRWDTGDSFDGSWACGPTSGVMAVSYYGALSSKPVTTSTPWSHSNPYGTYDSIIYTSASGHSFNAMQYDASGRPAYGAYGTCTEGGGAWAYMIQNYITWSGVGLTSTFYDSTSPSLIQNAINAGNLVIQSTQMSSAGHIVLIVGYTPSGSYVVHDPWGDATLPNWGIYPNGGFSIYSWTKLAAKWCIVVHKNKFGETKFAPKDPAFMVPLHTPVAVNSTA